MVINPIPMSVFTMNTNIITMGLGLKPMVRLGTMLWFVIRESVDLFLYSCLKVADLGSFVYGGQFGLRLEGLIGGFDYWIDPT